MKKIFISLLIFGLLTTVIYAQTGANSLDPQSEAYFVRIDRLIDRLGYLIMTMVVVTVALIGWILWNELKKTGFLVKRGLGPDIDLKQLNGMREDFSAIQSENLRLEEEIAKIKEAATELHTENNSLREDLAAINAYRWKHVVWLDWKGNEYPIRELDALRAAGLQNIARLTPEASEMVNLKSADLVILSYDASEASRDLFRKTIEALHQRGSVTPLIVYTLKGSWLDKNELEMLRWEDWQVTANLPVTLLSHTLALSHLNNSKPMEH